MAILGRLLPYIQIILAVLLVIGVLLQQSEASVGAAFGGGESLGAIQHTRRGFEKMLFNATIVLAILFVISALLALIVR